MNKILTSIIAISFALPALAEIFPNNGLMQENTAYDNAAIETNMDGVYEGSVDAIAQYDDMTFNVPSGQYLPADSEELADCPSGSYCPGLTNPVNYDATNNQGIESCPDGYGNSVTGAIADTQCYRTCDINNVGTSIAAVPHATALGGIDYYGNGIDACIATTCEHGYTSTGLSEAVGPLTDYVNITPNLGLNVKYRALNGDSGSNSGSSGLGAHAGMSNGEWSVAWPDGTTVHGMATCSTTQGTVNWNLGTFSTLASNALTAGDYGTETSGGKRYCWCQMDNYSIAGESTQTVASPSWVFNYARISASACADACADYCAHIFVGYTGFRAALVSLVTNTHACEANTITINWTDAADGTVEAANAGQCTYGGDIRTPVSAVSKPGKTFKGWVFSNPNN